MVREWHKMMVGIDGFSGSREGIASILSEKDGTTQITGYTLIYCIRIEVDEIFFSFNLSINNK